MATDQISPSVNKGQRSLEILPFITRYVWPFRNPSGATADDWRATVRGQQVAIISRDTIIATMVGTPWHIEARDADLSDQYSDEIEYYTNLFRTMDGGYTRHLELVLQDTLDTPFGAGVEVGHENDQPDGKVLWYKHIDSATLWPTPNDDFPVLQKLQWMPADIVVFPKHAIARCGWTPRPEIRYKGWFMAPPEKIYLGLEMLNRGDRYYSNLLTDTPEAGILDLMDMEEATAKSWLASWQELLIGVDPFKIPVLYEHKEGAKWIPFGRPPSEIIYDATTLKYASFVSGGYGLSLQDIGINYHGNSLAGQIRSERRSDRTGFGIARIKIKEYWEQILPPYLTFNFIDRDDEHLVAKGRARLANSMALVQLVNGGIIQNQDAQQQLIADGLVSVPLTEVGTPTPAKPKTQKHVVGNLLQNPVPPSAGGMGEVKTSLATDDLFVRQLVSAVMGEGEVPEGGQELVDELFYDLAKLAIDIDEGGNDERVSPIDVPTLE